MKAHALTLVAVLAAALPAHADNALRPERIPNKARELAERGRKHHEAGDYTAAVSAFKEAYVLAPSPSLLFNIAQAYRLGGKCDEAAWMYRRFLDTEPRGPQRHLAESQLSVVEKCGSGGLRITVTPPAIDTRAAVRTEPSLSLSLANEPETPRGSKLKRAGVYTAVGGGIMLIGAALFAIDAHNASNAVEDTYKRGGKWEDIEPLDDRGNRSATFATVLGVSGGVALVSAAVMYGVGKHRESENRFAIAPTKHGAQVSLSWGF